MCNVTYSYELPDGFDTRAVIKAHCNMTHSCLWPDAFIRRQHTAMHCGALQCTATHSNTPQHTATHRNTLQHTATHCNHTTPIDASYNKLQVMHQDICSLIALTVLELAFNRLPLLPTSLGHVPLHRLTLQVSCVSVSISCLCLLLVCACAFWHTTTEWHRPIGCRILAVSFHRLATVYKALLRRITCKDQASYEFSPPCS